MDFKLFATARPINDRYVYTLTGIPFATAAEALERAAHLHRFGWSIYRITGPDGFEMSRQAIAEHFDAPNKLDKAPPSPLPA